MKEKYGREYVKDKIRNRLRTLKHHYNHIKTLMGLSGFGWDDVTKKVTASDQVWDDYITVSNYKYINIILNIVDSIIVTLFLSTFV